MDVHGIRGSLQRTFRTEICLQQSHPLTKLLITAVLKDLAQVLRLHAFSHILRKQLQGNAVIRHDVPFRHAGRAPCLVGLSICHMDVPGPAADSHDQPYAEFLFHAGADASGQLFHMAVGRTLNQKNLPAGITKHQTSRSC